jgi:parallel beta-helix repeat protein
VGQDGIYKTLTGDLKWVYLALNLSPAVRIDEVSVCYQVSNANSFVSQVRLTQIGAPNQAVVIHDDPTDLKSTSAVCYTSSVGGKSPTPGTAVMLALRLSFADVGDRILLGAVGVKYRCSGECTLNPRDFGATGDGVADDTAALQAVFAAVPDEGALVCVPPGTYLLSSALALKSNTYLKGVGPGSLFKRSAAGSETLFYSEGVSGVTIESISLDLNGAGIGQPKDFATGIAFRSQSSNIRIRDTRIFDGTGTTVRGRHAILVLESNHVWIEDNYVSDGLRIKAGGVGDRLVIRNNFIEEPNDNGITIATHVGQTSTVNYVIQGNTVRAAKGSSIYVGDDGFGLDHPGVEESGIVYQNILIDGNFLLGPVGSGQSMITVHLANVTERLHIVNNVLVNSGPVEQFTQGIESSIQGTFGRPGADLLIAGNTVDGNFDHAGIWMRSWSRVRIANNQVSNGSSNGIRLGAVDIATIQGNVVADCSRGILAEDSTQLLATGNSFHGLSAQGVLLVTSDASKTTSLHFAVNQVTDNGAAGIEEQGSGTFDTHYFFNDLRGNAGGAFQNINANTTMTGNLT